MPLLQRCPWPASLVNLSGSPPKQHLGWLIVCLHSSVCLFVSYLFSQTASSWEQGLACIAHFTLSALHCTEKASTENTKTRRRGACRQSASSRLSDTYSSAGGWLHSAVTGRDRLLNFSPNLCIHLNCGPEQVTVPSKCSQNGRQKWEN